MIRILIADDHPIVREGLKRTVSDTDDLVVGGEAANGQELMQLVRDDAGDIVLLDINMPGRNGLDILKEIVAYAPDLPVLMMSIYPVERYADISRRLGATGYFSKENVSDELIHAIRKVASGEKYTG